MGLSIKMIAQKLLYLDMKKEEESINMIYSPFVDKKKR
jgi:hypothetical protein